MNNLAMHTEPLVFRDASRMKLTPECQKELNSRLVWKAYRRACMESKKSCLIQSAYRNYYQELARFMEQNAYILIEPLLLKPDFSVFDR